jgi:uncharacterized protein YggU (UPF0235/DUF167 family)
VHVHPGARRTAVGGAHGVDGDHLVVRVGAPAVGGAANAAVCAALASAFDVRPTAVAVVGGGHRRDKLVEVRGAPAGRLAALLAGPPATTVGR